MQLKFESTMSSPPPDAPSAAAAGAANVNMSQAYQEALQKAKQVNSSSKVSYHLKKNVCYHSRTAI